MQQVRQSDLSTFGRFVVFLFTVKVKTTDVFNSEENIVKLTVTV